MYGLTRATLTLIGVGAAGVLLWLATQMDADTNSEYWAQVGLLAAAGLGIALSQLLGGWTKWGWPRISAAVFLFGFLPALVAGGLVILDAQPGDAFGASWAGVLGLEGLSEDLSAFMPAIAFGLGLVFGLTFDTSGPRTRPVVEDESVVEKEQPGDRERVVGETTNGGGAVEGGTPVAPQPEPVPRAAKPDAD